MINNHCFGFEQNSHVPHTMKSVHLILHAHWFLPRYTIATHAGWIRERWKDHLTRAAWPWVWRRIPLLWKFPIVWHVHGKFRHFWSEGPELRKQEQATHIHLISTILNFPESIVFTTFLYNCICAFLNVLTILNMCSVFPSIIFNLSNITFQLVLLIGPMNTMNARSYPVGDLQISWGWTFWGGLDSQD